MAFIKTYHFEWTIDENPDETEFCAKTVDEAVTLFDTFCHEEDIDPEDVSLCLRWNAEDANEYGKDYIPVDYYLDRVTDYSDRWDLTREEHDSDDEDTEFE